MPLMAPAEAIEASVEAISADKQLIRWLIDGMAVEVLARDASVVHQLIKLQKKCIKVNGSLLCIHAYCDALH